MVDFNAETQGMDMIAWANADTVRILSGVDVSAEDVVLSKDQTALLNAASENDIFSAPETTLSAAAGARARWSTAAAPKAPSARLVQLRGSWHFLLARLEDLAADRPLHQRHQRVALLPGHRRPRGRVEGTPRGRSRRAST